MDLKDIRNNIDDIDTQICALFKQRMDLALEVAKEKEKMNIPVLNTEREQEILNRVAGEVGEPLSAYVKHLFNTLFEVSKDYQAGYLNKNK